jgi:hypothetical protein
MHLICCNLLPAAIALLVTKEGRFLALRELSARRFSVFAFSFPFILSVSKGIELRAKVSQ